MSFTYLLKLKQLSEEEQDKICNSFLSFNKTHKQLSIEYDVPISTMIAFLKYKGIAVGSYLKERNEAIAKAAVEDYISGTLLKDVTVKHQVSSDIVYSYMHRHGIEYKNEHGRKNFFNQRFFQNIDREDKAYFLGYLYADGWIGGVQKGVYERPCNINLDISSKDRCILEKYLECIESSGSTHIHDYIASERTYKASPMSAVRLTSTKMADDLISHGFKGLKPDRETVPELPSNMIRHFVRGYFDGDGCATTNTIQITGQISFLNNLGDTIDEHLNISHPPVRSYYENKTVGDLFYNRLEYRQSIFNWFYNSSSIYLQRKKDRFQDTLK